MVDTGSGGFCRLSLVLFEAYWADHADRGVAPSTVVAFLDPASGRRPGRGFGAPVVPVVELGLQGRPERFCGGVVPARAGASHGP